MAKLNFKNLLIDILGVDFRYPKGSYYETFLPNLPDGITDPANITDTHLATLGDDWFNPNYAWGGTWILETEGQVHVSAGTNYIVNGAPTNTSDGGATTAQTNDHTLTLNEIPSHNHVNPAYAGKSVRTWGTSEKNKGTTSWGWGEYVVAQNFFASAGGGHAHNHGSVDTMQPYIVVYRWLRTA